MCLPNNYCDLTVDYSYFSFADLQDYYHAIQFAVNLWVNNTARILLMIMFIKSSRKYQMSIKLDIRVVFKRK